MKTLRSDLRLCRTTNHKKKPTCTEPLIQGSMHIGLLDNSPARQIRSALYVVVQFSIGFQFIRKQLLDGGRDNTLNAEVNLCLWSAPELVRRRREGIFNVPCPEKSVHDAGTFSIHNRRRFFGALSPPGRSPPVLLGNDEDLFIQRRIKDDWFGGRGASCCGPCRFVPGSPACFLVAVTYRIVDPQCLHATCLFSFRFAMKYRRVAATGNQEQRTAETTNCC